MEEDTMSQTSYRADEVVRRGEEIYQRDLKSKVEPIHNGEILVLDIDTGDYEIDREEVAALKRAIDRHPNGTRYIKRIGFPATHRLGGRFVARQK
jgi:hypothetical protein